MKQTLSIVLLIILLAIPATAQKSKRKRVRTAKPKIVYVPVVVEPSEVTKSFIVPANGYSTMTLGPYGDQGTTLDMRYEAQGGSGNDIEVFILDEDGMTNWKNGHSTPTFYNSGRKTVGNIDVTLGEGVYFLIFNNKFSTFTPKAITLTIRE
jgi:hypothetical protein